MKYAIVIWTILGFVWLAHASLHEPMHHYAKVEHHKTLKQRQAEALADIYGLTDEDIAKPVVLFGE